MRKIIALLLTFALTLPLASCADAPKEPVERMNKDDLFAFAQETVTDRMPGMAGEIYWDSKYGTYETIEYYSKTCKRDRRAVVLLPADYDKSKDYPVLYAMHGYWGDENSLPKDGSLKLQYIIGNAIAAGEAEEMIVVFPYIFASETREVLDGMNAESNAAYDNFINDLVNDLMPYIKKHYSILEGRESTAITGFSMGGRESLYIGLERTDLFGYIGAVCPAPGVGTDLLSNEEMKFAEGEEPYILYITAGAVDTVVYTVPHGYHDIFTQNGVDHIWQLIDGAGHDGSSIRPHFYNFIRLIFKKP